MSNKKMAAATNLLLGVLVTTVQADMKQIPVKSSLALSVLGTVNSTLLERCNGDTFAEIDVFGAKVLDVSATPLQNYSTTVMDVEFTGLNFCNITVTYTHPGRDDKVNVFATLPLAGWNGRFQGRGGGGFITGVDAATLAPATAQGFAAASTDGGHTLYEQSAESWALNSPGNINWNLLEDYAYSSLADMTIIGKQLTSQYYSSPPKYSYWTGCSTGGRQGLVFAQRFPELYDGILALAPAINLDKFVVAEYFVQHVMNRIGQYPLPCELDAINNAAVEACDALDGVEDGVISFPSLCKFAPNTLIGKEFDCDGETLKFTKAGTVAANAFYNGPVNPAEREKWYWYGMNYGTPLNGIASTECATSSASSCQGSPFVVAEEFIRLFLQKDPDFATTNMTDDEYFGMFHRATQEYSSMLGTSDPDLSLFKAHGAR